MNEANPDVIESPRLRLVPMGAAVLRKLRDGDIRGADALVGASGFDRLDDGPRWIGLRLSQIESNPALETRLMRAIVLRDANVIAGHIGFHAEPDAPYLIEIGLRGLEIGYTVHEPYRRQGIATEAVRAMIEWAQTVHGVDSFVASISPANTPSLRLVRRLGFQKVSSHVDDVDGPEDIYVLFTTDVHSAAKPQPN
jgi:GNAT superfamily N-acetyltransferase